MLAIDDRPARAEAAWEPSPAIGPPRLTNPDDRLLLHRLRWVAFGLTIVYGTVLIWVLSTRDDLHQPAVVLLGLRVTLGMAFLGLLFGPIAEIPSRLRWCELAVFGGLAIGLALSQYLIGRDLVRANDGPKLLAFEQDLLVELLILMFAYGTLIPSSAPRTAGIVAMMALAPILALVTLLMSEAVSTPILESLRSLEYAGQNALTVGIGAGLAIHAGSTQGRRRPVPQGITGALAP
jgi:hypothetical protein